MIVRVCLFNLLTYLLFLSSAKHHNKLYEDVSTFTYIITNGSWFVGHHLMLLMDFRPYVKTFINVCIVTTVCVVW
jgi:hypothetical protein